MIGIFVRFLIGWGIAFGVLVIVSCVKYKDFISAAVMNNTLAWINAVMPCVIIIAAILYLIRLVLR